MTSPLQNHRDDVRIKLALLWVSTMFCFIYGDYFELYTPYKLTAMLEGQIGPLGDVTQGKLLGTSVMMSVPSLMAAFSVLSTPALCKWINVVVASIFVVISVLVIQGAWIFYVYFGIVEILLLVSIIWLAWRWHPSAA